MATKPGTRMTQRGEQTRDQIMQAGRKLFTERGYHNTSVYDLFDQAETTKGAFFHHWKTKEDLALSILERMEAFFQHNFFTLVEVPKRGRELFDTALTLLRDAVSGNGSYLRLFAIWCMELAENEDKLGPAVHALRNRWCKFWEYLIRRAQEDHDIRTDLSAESLSLMVVAAIFGVQLLRDDSGVQIEQTYQALRATLLT
jgi:AcrR family transcriptional regulator